MAINERLIHTAADAAGGETGNQEEGLILHLDANDVDSYDSDGDVWYDIKDHEYTPATNVSEHFNTVTYSGASTAQSITGVGFQPDMVWIKSRNLVNNHVLLDSVRGKNGGTTFENVYPNLTNAQANDNPVTSLDADGFSLANSQQNGNHSSYTYVAWCFKAGGAPTATNTSQSTQAANSISIDGVLQEAGYTHANGVDNYPYKASVNTKLGFSICSWEANGANRDRIPHFLGEKPEMLILKRTSQTSAWTIWHKGLSSDSHRLTFTSGQQVSAPSIIEDITSGYFEIGTGIHGVQGDWVSYAFTSKRGVSKVGSYKGTGASGNKVYTGFEPAFLLQKETNTSGPNWHIWDNVRDSNPIEKILIPNTNSAEGTVSSGITFNRDGFTINTTNGNINGNGDNYIYYAVAKNTNETSLIPDRASFTEGSVTTGAELELDANDYSGSGNWLDSSGNNNDGTISGATYVDDGNSDYFDFDGSDSDEVTVSHNAALDITSTGFTVEAWVNPDDTGYNTLVAKFSTSASIDGYSLAFNSGDIFWRLYTSSSGVGTCNYTTGSVATTNTWHHIVGTVSGTASGSTMKLYQNGELLNTTTTTGTYVTTTRDLRIGGYDYADGRNFDGKIGQVRIYSSALTPQQVQSNYDATKVYALPSLALHLDADSFPEYGESDYYSNTPPTWTDSSGNSYNGSINGAVFDSELGNWLDFDGVNDEVNWSTFPTAFESLTAITMELWVKFDTVSGTQYPIWLGRPASGKSVNIGLVGGKIQTWVGYYGYPSLFTPVANKWYHLAVTISGSTQAVYVDGEDYTNNSSTSGISMDSNGANAFLLGDYSGGTADFNGKIGQVRIYSSALTQDQVRQNYNFTKNNYPNGFDGTITGATWNPSGYFDFDGFNDSVTLPSSLRDIFDSPTRSLSFWFRTDLASTTQVPFSHNHTSDNYGRTSIVFTNTNKITVLVGGLGSYPTTGALNTNQWYHLAVSVNENTYTAYLDGVSFGTATKDNYVDDTIFYIGRDAASNPYWFNGKISKVKMYDKALTQEEITALYNEGE